MIKSSYQLLDLYSKFQADFDTALDREKQQPR